MLVRLPLCERFVVIVASLASSYAAGFMHPMLLLLKKSRSEHRVASSTLRERAIKPAFDVRTVKKT